MKPKFVLGVVAILIIVIGISILLTSHKDGGIFSTPTVSLTLTPSSTRSRTPTPTVPPTMTISRTPTSIPTITFMIVCTPPVCAIGTNEIYYCPGTCPGGCGTTCATFTVTP
jgi:hypothetical protein